MAEAKVVEEKVEGGEIVFEDRDDGFFSFLSLDDLSYKKGDVTPKKAITKYEAVLRIPYTISVTEELEGAIKDGKQRKKNPNKYFDVEIKIPFKFGHAEGTFRVPVWVKDGQDIDQQILLAIGEKLHLQQYGSKND